MTVAAKPINLGCPIPSRLILTASFLWAFLVILCSAAACVHLPLFIAWPWILVACVGATGYFVLTLRPVKLGYGGPLALAVSLAAVFWVLRPYVFPARFISIFLDAWSYCAFSEYIARFPIGVHDGLSPLYQWASHLSATRYGTPSILAFLGGFTTLGPLEALPYYLALVFLNVFWGVCLLARTLGCSPWMSVVAGCFSVSCGLIPDVMIAGNFDNLLFLSLLPGLIVRLRLYGLGKSRLTSSVGLAGSLAAAIYAYPEGALIAGVIYLPVFLWFFLRTFRGARRVVLAGRVALLTLVFLAPYRVILLQFLQAQISAGMTAAPGAGMFPGFFLGSILPSLLGTGAEWVGAPASWVDGVFATICVALMMAALPRLVRRRPDLLASIVLLLLFGFWQGCLLHYSYGLFKVLNLGAIVTGALLFLGLQEICRPFFARSTRAWPVLIATGVIVLSAGERRRNTGGLPVVATPKVRTYAALRRVPPLLGDAPLLVSMDNAFDQAWAIYFLGDAPLAVDRYLGYMGHPFLRLWMNNAKRIAAYPDHVLSNTCRSNSIWKSGKFWLSPRSKLDPLLLLNSPNGVDLVGGKPFIWIDHRPVEFLVDTREACEAAFRCVNTMPGPSLPERDERSICVRNGDFLQRLKVQGGFSVKIPLHQGQNKIEIWDEDLPTSTKFSDRDPRVLLLGISEYQIEPIEP